MRAVIVAAVSTGAQATEEKHSLECELETRHQPASPWLRLSG